MVAAQDRWIWPFELTEKIGEGGMGVVYRARYVVNDRPVAVKLLPSDVTDETLLGRFEREVEILKTLRHPNIVLCFGGVCENKRRFYAMELVEGGTLDDLLRKRGRLPWEMVVEYARQMCSALAYAHERGVVHRDIKPGNFLLKGDGQLKLSDFGLATLLAGRKITAEGRTAGTYEYMAPEQITGKNLSPQTDLYALGCVLYELLTGRPPFVGDNPAAVLHAHLKQPPPRVAVEYPECPASLDSLIAHLMAKAPEDRPPSAAAVGARLAEISPIVRVEGGAPTTGVSNRPTTVSPRTQLDRPASEFAPRGGIAVPAWGAPVAVALLGLLATGAWMQSQKIQTLGQAESEWVTMFRQGNLAERMRAARTLGRLGGRSPAAYEALVKGLDDPDPFIRESAAAALGECGAAARDLIPTLMKMQQRDEASNVRSAAGRSVESLKAAPSRARSGLWPILATALATTAAALWARRRSQPTD